MPANPSCRAWSWTLQVATVDEARQFQVHLDDGLQFVRYQLEVAPTTGQLHLQGCIRTCKACRMNKVKTYVSAKAHCEPARDWQDLKKYCAKEASRHPENIQYEWGTDIGQGARTDLDTVARSIIQGTPVGEVAVANPGIFVRYHKGLRALAAIADGPKTMVGRRCVLLWGATGVGKTRMAYDNFAAKDIYNVFDVHTPWFDGYEGQKIAILDEMGPGCMGYNNLKRICDIHPMAVPCKGGSATWNAEVVILTANTPIEEWYPHARPADLEALKRRIKIFRLPEEAEDATEYVKSGQVCLRKRDRSPEVVRSVDLMRPTVATYGLQDIWSDAEDLSEICERQTREREQPYV